MLRVLRLVVVLGIAGLSVNGAGFIDIDSIDATALGTLLLAVGTFWLAFLTRRLLGAAQTDRRTALGALKASERQASIAEEALATAERSAAEAVRTRFDETAPLLGLIVTPEAVSYFRGTGENREQLQDQHWEQFNLDDIRIEALVPFTITKWGRSPAHVFFPSMNPDPESVIRKTGGSRNYVIPPAATYEDIQTYRLTGRQALEGVQCEIKVTCNSELFGATFDTLRSRGTLQPLRLDGGHLRRNDQIPLNAGAAQFVREYPLLERPEEMKKLAEQIRLGEQQ